MRRVTAAVLVALVGLTGCTPIRGNATRHAPMTTTPTSTTSTLADSANDTDGGRAGACGVERWSVKVGLDPDVSAIDMVPKDTTVAAMNDEVPGSLGGRRDPPVETSTWRVHATMTAYKVEADSDIHIVLSDLAGGTMIAEIPSPDCMGSSPLKPAVATVRAHFDDRFHPGHDAFTTTAVDTTVTGVGFFDFKHGQRGVARNAIELHPVLDMAFGTLNSSGPATTLTSPPTTGISTPGSGCTATVGDPHPVSTETVHVISGLADSAVTVTTHYRTTTSRHTGQTDASGAADVTFGIGRPTPGYTVAVDVDVAGKADCSTSFTP